VDQVEKKEREKRGGGKEICQFTCSSKEPVQEQLSNQMKEFQKEQRDRPQERSFKTVENVFASLSMKDSMHRALVRMKPLASSTLHGKIL